MDKEIKKELTESQGEYRRKEVDKSIQNERLKAYNTKLNEMLSQSGGESIFNSLKDASISTLEKSYDSLKITINNFITVI